MGRQKKLRNHRIVPGYEALAKNLALQLVNHGLDSSAEIAQALSFPTILVEEMMLEFKQRGLIQCTSKNLSGGLYCLVVSAQLKRMVRDDTF